MTSQQSSSKRLRGYELDDIKFLLYFRSRYGYIDGVAGNVYPPLDYLMYPYSKESANHNFDANDANDDNIVNNASKITAYNEKEDNEANDGDDSKTGSDIYNSDAEDIKERKLRKNI